MCNYGTEEMPFELHPFKKKFKDEQIIHPQDITESRTAEVASLHAKAEESRKRFAANGSNESYPHSHFVDIIP